MSSKWEVSFSTEQSSELSNNTTSKSTISRDLSPSASHIPHYTIEQNGLHAAAIICFNGTGIITERSTLLFPTRLVDRQNPRGYLQCQLELPVLPSPPTKATYDGTSINLIRPSFDETDPLSYELKIFVSPDSPVIHMLLTHNKQQLISNRKFPRATSRIIKEDGGYTILQIHNWKDDLKTLHIAFSCLPLIQTPSPLLDLQKRNENVNKWVNQIQLKCPDKHLMSFCHFAKIRTSEALFQSPTIGLVHSPGGNMFYCGVWCNDQIEYVAPLFPFLHASKSMQCNAIRQSIRTISEHIDFHSKSIPYSVEIDGGYIGRLDRGDAAMFVVGTCEFILAINNNKNDSNHTQFIDEVKPCLLFAADAIIEKSFENESGVVPSQSDELEGRYPTGDINFSTNTLSIHALFLVSQFLLFTTHLAKYKTNNDYKQKSIRMSNRYRDEAIKLRSNVSEYFKINKLWRYDYFKGCEHARGWVCLSGLANLSNARNCLHYCLTSLWQKHGVRVISNNEDVWDRCTLYSIMLAFQNNLSDLAVNRLLTYAQNRVSENVSAPYAVECQQSGAQLSAESSLVLRVIIHGLLGLKPLADGSVYMKPTCPSIWPSYQVDKVYLNGEHLHDFEISRENRGDTCMLSIIVHTRNGSSGVSIVEGTGLKMTLDESHGPPLSFDVVDKEWFRTIS